MKNKINNTHKKIILIFISSLIIFSLISEINADEGWFEKLKKDPVINTISKTTQNLLGFGVEDQRGSFIYYFRIGFLGGLWIWILFSIIKLIRSGVIRFGLKNRIIERDSKIRWFGIIAGRIWKVIIIGIVYAVILHIPIINRFVQIITFDALVEKIIAKSFIVAFYIGLGPALFEYLTQIRFHLKLEKKVIAAQRGRK